MIVDWCKAKVLIILSDEDGKWGVDASQLAVADVVIVDGKMVKSRFGGFPACASCNPESSTN